jgi:hypothetical protein
MPVDSLDLTKHHIIKLKPKVYELKPVEVKGTIKVSRLGNEKVGRTYTGWGDFQSLRGRIRGLLIEGIECSSKVKSLSFRINHNEWDSVAFRINFVSVENGKPVTSLLQQNIFVTTSQKHRWVTADLQEYNIILCSKTLVTLEWVDAWGKTGEFSNMLTLSLSKNPGYTFVREPNEELGSFTMDENSPAMFIEVFGN